MTSGLEQIRAIHEGRHPPAPVQELIGYSLHEVAEGRTVFRIEPRREQENPMGSIHGGIAMTLLDSAMGAAVHTTLAPGEAYGTLDINVNLVRPIMAGSGPLLAQGEVVHRGSRVATAQARLVGEDDGKLYAHATCTCMILQPR